MRACPHCFLICVALFPADGLAVRVSVAPIELGASTQRAPAPVAARAPIAHFAAREQARRRANGPRSDATLDGGHCLPRAEAFPFGKPRNQLPSPRQSNGSVVFARPAR